MAPLSSLLTITLATTATAFSVNSGVASTSARPSTKLYENFGFDFAEDQAENTPSIILGEANYKKWVNSVDPNNMLNRQVSSFGDYFCGFGSAAFFGMLFGERRRCTCSARGEVPRECNQLNDAQIKEKLRQLKHKSNSDQLVSLILCWNGTSISRKTALDSVGFSGGLPH